MKNTVAKAAISGAVFLLALLGTTTANADYSVKCASSGYKHATCRLSQPGRVTLQRQVSGASCKQGRTWDYDSRQIWVDDGCSGEFRVDTSSHGHSSAGAAAGMVAAAILLGALADSDQGNVSKYKDDDYHGPRHSSYVADWMVGQFRGVNSKYDNTDVLMTIKPDGRVTALAKGQTINGYINDDYLHAGDVVFTINRTRDGFVTSQVGDQYNVVHYRRIN